MNERGRNSILNALDFVRYDLSEYFLKREGKRITAKQLQRVYKKYMVKHEDHFFDYQDLSFACAVLNCRRLGHAIQDPIWEIMIGREMEKAQPGQVVAAYFRSSYD